MEFLMDLTSVDLETIMKVLIVEHCWYFEWEARSATAVGRIEEVIQIVLLLNVTCKAVLSRMTNLEYLIDSIDCSILRGVQNFSVHTSFLLALASNNVFIIYKILPGGTLDVILILYTCKLQHNL